jgi:hypothetical protein
LADENGLNRQGVAAVITSDRQLELRRERAPEADKALLTPGHEAGPVKAVPAVQRETPEQIADEKEKITSPARYALHAEILPVGMTSKDRVAAIVVKDGSRFVSDNPKKDHPGGTIKGYAVVRDYTQEFQGGHKISASRVMPNIQEDAPIQQSHPIHNPYTSREQAEEAIATLHGYAPFGQLQGMTEIIEEHRRSDFSELKPLDSGAQAQVQDQKRLNIRNEDQQAQEKKATEKKIERKAQERDKSQERAMIRTRVQKEVGLER